MSGATPDRTGRIAGVDIDRNVEAGATGPDHQGPELHQLAHPDRAEEVQPAKVHRDAIGAGPSGGAGVSGLVDPFHHGAAVDLAPEVHILRLGQEPERHSPLPLHRYSSTTAVPLALTMSIPPPEPIWMLSYSRSTATTAVPPNCSASASISRNAIVLALRSSCS